jgi:hypothetical protein
MRYAASRRLSTSRRNRSIWFQPSPVGATKFPLLLRFLPPPSTSRVRTRLASLSERPRPGALPRGPTRWLEFEHRRSGRAERGRPGGLAPLVSGGRGGRQGQPRARDAPQRGDPVLVSTGAFRIEAPPPDSSGTASSAAVGPGTARPPAPLLRQRVGGGRLLGECPRPSIAEPRDAADR